MYAHPPVTMTFPKTSLSVRAQTFSPHTPPSTDQETVWSQAASLPRIFYDQHHSRQEDYYKHVYTHLHENRRHVVRAGALLSDTGASGTVCIILHHAHLPVDGVVVVCAATCRAILETAGLGHCAATTRFFLYDPLTRSPPHVPLDESRLATLEQRTHLYAWNHPCVQRTYQLIVNPHIQPHDLCPIDGCARTLDHTCHDDPHVDAQAS
jgi:hypothetical protein